MMGRAVDTVDRNRQRAQRKRARQGSDCKFRIKGYLDSERFRPQALPALSRIAKTQAYPSRPVRAPPRGDFTMAMLDQMNT